MSSDLLDRAAKALYDHWVEEDFANEYVSWKLLPDKQTWRERAAEVFKAIAGDSGHDATECIFAVGDDRRQFVWQWDRVCSNTAGSLERSEQANDPASN